MVNFPARIPDCDSVLSLALLDLFLVTLGFVPQWLSFYLEILVMLLSLFPLTLYQAHNRVPVSSLFHMKITASVTKNSHKDLGPYYIHVPFFSYTYILLFCWKIKSCFDCCFPQQVILQNTV